MCRTAEAPNQSDYSEYVKYKNGNHSIVVLVGYFKVCGYVAVLADELGASPSQVGKWSLGNHLATEPKSPRFRFRFTFSCVPAVSVVHETAKLVAHLSHSANGFRILII